MKKVLLAGLLACIVGTAVAQKGFVRGKIIDGETGEGLFGATATKQGTTQGAVADFDGNYSLALEPGTHTIVVQFISYQSKVIEGVQVVAGEVTNLDVTIAEDVQQLESVVVTAEQIRDNEVALLSVQKKSVNTVDGISSAAFKKVGDSNLSSAMKRVTGVTVQGGKYVYVRGLGDRYTKTSLNGMVVPGLDPDRNDVQIDIFPTGILENVMVYKTFTPNLTGDFTGGLIDIQTKAFPEEKSTSVSLGFGYNPDMHFKSNSVGYDGSSTDAFGWDNGQRELPVDPNVEIPTIADDNVGATTRKFDPTLGTNRAMNFMNTSLSFSHRNQIQGEKVTWGYNAILSYKNTQEFYQDFTRKRYERDRTTSEITLERDYSAAGDLGTNNVLWSGLVSLAAKTDNHTVGTNLLHTQNGVSTAVQRNMRYTSLNNPTYLHNSILAYSQRSMTNSILYGKHNFNKLRVEWTNSLLFSTILEPDYRDTRINEDDPGVYLFQNGGGIDRFWRELNEVSENFKLDFIYDLNDKNKLKAGGMFTTRQREFDVYSYTYYPLDAFDITSTNANDLLTEDNLYSSSNTNGAYIQDQSNDYNNYEGKQNVYAAYLMNEMQVIDKLKAIYGVRFENAQMYYTGIKIEDDKSQTLQDNAKTLDVNNFLPSLNLVYNLQEDMNLRASANKTLARPSFKEKSSAFIEDPITKVIFSGNLDIKQAEIWNYDLRWEYFFTPGEMVSVSGFYKNFDNHISLVFLPNTNEDQVKPRNVGEAEVYGTEVEFRKNLAFVHPVLEDISIGSNVSLVMSRVNRSTVPVDDEGLFEYDSDVQYQNTSEGVEKYRDMTGQSPYVINGYLNYENRILGITGNLSYNVQGETLTFVGVTKTPDVYTAPFHSLNFKISKTLGEKGNSMVSLKAENLLNDDKELNYKYKDETQTFSIFSPGRAFTLKYTYNF